MQRALIIIPCGNKRVLFDFAKIEYGKLHARKYSPKKLLVFALARCVLVCVFSICWNWDKILLHFINFDRKFSLKLVIYRLNIFVEDLDTDRHSTVSEFTANISFDSYMNISWALRASSQNAYDTIRRMIHIINLMKLRIRLSMESKCMAVWVIERKLRLINIPPTQTLHMIMRCEEAKLTMFKEIRPSFIYLFGCPRGEMERWMRACKIRKIKFLLVSPKIKLNWEILNKSSSSRPQTPYVKRWDFFYSAVCFSVFYFFYYCYLLVAHANGCLFWLCV